MRQLAVGALLLLLLPACSPLGAGGGYGTSASWIETSFPKAIVGDGDAELTWTLRHVRDSIPQGPFDCIVEPDNEQDAFFSLTPSIRGGPAPLTVEFETLAVYAGELGPGHPVTCALVYDDLTTDDTGRIWRPCNQGADNAFEPADLVHTYTQPGVYQVCLTAWLPGSDSGF